MLSLGLLTGAEGGEEEAMFAEWRAEIVSILYPRQSQSKPKDPPVLCMRLPSTGQVRT